MQKPKKRKPAIEKLIQNVNLMRNLYEELQKDGKYGLEVSRRRICGCGIGIRVHIIKNATEKNENRLKSSQYQSISDVWVFSVLVSHPRQITLYNCSGLFTECNCRT